MNVPKSPARYSAAVRLELHVNDATFELAEIGPTWVYLRQPLQLPPCDAKIVMTVDGQKQTWQVCLPRGSSSDSPVVETRGVASPIRDTNGVG